MRENELVIYRSFLEDELFQNMAWLMNNYRDEYYNMEDKVNLYYDCLHKLFDIAASHDFCGNIWHCYLANLLVNSENCYSMAAEERGEPVGSINIATLHDIQVLKQFYDFDFNSMLDFLGVSGFEMIENYEKDDKAGKIYNTRISNRICELAKRMAADSSAAEMKDSLTQFYKEYGVGRFGLHKSFRIVHSGEDVIIEPILNIAHVHFDDLIGYEQAKAKLIENTDAFVAGKRANNCLLFGDAGTGKSSCIKALANEYYERGLRIIEVYKHQFQDLHGVISQIKNRNYKFIIYMDDLSFEDFEIEYKYLKAVIEGGMEKRPENVLIYATSNRRHLIRENYTDKEEIRVDMHTGDTVQEKLSLAYRFGVTIYFGKPSPKEFQTIVTTLAKRAGIDMPEEELLSEANKWELSHGGISGRTASQFIDYLLGK